MEFDSLPTFIGGTRIEPDQTSPEIRTIDGLRSLRASETSLVQLRKALRHADGCQERLRQTSLADRIEAARRVVSEYERRADQACWALAHFRGLAARDCRWMCRVNVSWAEDFEELVQAMFGGAIRREIHGRGTPLGTLEWRTKGKACLFSSSTMDGPAAVVALCHAMISGTHLILKPSFRDAATHLAFETLYEQGLEDYAQLVRWRSESSEAHALNRQLLGHVSQSVIFASSESFHGLLNGVAPAGTEEWDALSARTKRYGTGLPLAIVTARCDLERTAADLVEGARLGGGRFCLSTGPILVERSCQEPLVQRIVAHAQKLRRGAAIDPATDLSSHDLDSAEAMRRAVRSFGGRWLHGEIRETDMDVIVLSDVPLTSAALHREVPGPVLSLIPVDDLKEATRVSTAALRRNHREAWTAVVVFGSQEDVLEVHDNVDSFRYLEGGVVAQVKLLLPHQGSYFALDLMRRASVEHASAGNARDPVC